MKQETPDIELSLQDLRTLYDRAQMMGKNEPHETVWVYTSCYLLMQQNPLFRVTVHYRDRSTKVFEYTYSQIQSDMKP